MDTSTEYKVGSRYITRKGLEVLIDGIEDYDTYPLKSYTHGLSWDLNGRFVDIERDSSLDLVSGPVLRAHADTAVETPSHYTQYEIEPIVFIMKNKLPFAEGNVVKYIVRHKAKNGAEDVKKAIRYCQEILEEDYQVEAKVTYA